MASSIDDSLPARVAVLRAKIQAGKAAAGDLRMRLSALSYASLSAPLAEEVS